MWRYEASGRDLGGGWKEVDFDDSAWPRGKGPLGWETTSDQLPAPLQTSISMHGGIAYYFRTTFNFPTNPVGFELTFTNLLDDGAVCYLNGAELWRVGLPPGPVFHTNAANRTVGNAAFESITVPAHDLVRGTNVLALEVHQANATSSDFVMGTMCIAAPAPPSRLSITNQPESVAAREADPAAFSVAIAGQGARIQWFMQGTAIAGANLSRLYFPRLKLSDAGDYRVVLSNSFGATTSQVASLKVIPGKPPVIAAQPASQTISLGESTSFTAIVTGDEPFAFQWFRNDVPLVGETNPDLRLERALPSDAGDYSFSVSNYFGMATSQKAGLTVRKNPRGDPGAIDRNFIANPSQPVRAVAVQPDGLVLIGGSFELVNDTRQGLLARLRPDGSLDANFKPDFGGSAGSHIFVIEPLDDRRILVGGVFSSVNGVARPSLGMLKPDGSLDATFAPAPSSPAWVRDVALQTDGKILVVGGAGPESGEIARLNPDGSIDKSFAPAIRAINYFTSVAVQQNGDILVAGTFPGDDPQSRRYLVRLHPDGSLDTGFLPDMQGPNAAVQFLEVAGDKILVGGNFTALGRYSCHGLVRLNPNGAPDPDFNPPEIRGGGYGVDSVLVLPDGKLLVTGDFATVESIPRKGIARLQADGRLDSSFDIGTGASMGYERVRRAALDAKGDLVIAGFFTGFNGVPQPYVARLIGGEP